MEEETHGSTLFVSNLPYTATSTDIQTLFSDIAPVRSAFVVLDKETKVSKGVAYVSFAIKEDAALALESEKPFEVDGRVLRLQWADRKGVPHHSEKPSPTKAKKPPRPSAPSDPEAIRTLVVSNLPAGIDSKALWKKARKVKGASEVVFPAPEHDEHTAFVKFSSPADASAAVAKLHNHVFKGSRLSATIKKRVDKLVSGRKSGAPSRSSRLIIRNLPWHLTEKDLHELFTPYGPIYSITYPTDASTGRHRGFAFVWMLSHGDAERALKGVNGRTVGAPKKQKKTRREREAAAREKAAARLRALKGGQAEEEEEPESEDEEETKGAAKEGRVVAVDWALSKNKWEETVSQRQEEEAMEVDEESEKGSEEGSKESEGSEEEASEGSDNEGGDSEEGSDDEEAHERPKLPDTDVGTTLFVRNVPFEATEDDLRTLFRAFGPLRYARITLDHETGRSRGTGFVCFWKKEDADAAIEEAETMAKELGTNTAGPSKVHNPFSMSLLTPDPSASLAQRLVLHGRTLSVARAVTRNEADRLREEGERSREKQDKRNLYLMREGVIFPNSTAAGGLPEAELATRQASFDARRALLRSNPSLYVSRTRLSVRRLPLWASERVLKRLAIHAIREYEVEVQKGARDPLTRDELQADPDPDSPKPKPKKGRNTGIQQAKIVRAADRVDAVTGKGRSRGYGFIETAVHADALRILRWTNNRPGVAGLMRGWWKEEVKDLIAAAEGDRARRLEEELQRLDAEGDEARGSGKTLILEFAIENVQVVKRRKERVEAVRSGVDGHAKKRKAVEPANEADEPTGPAKKRRKDSKEQKAHSQEKKSKPEKRTHAGKTSGVDPAVKAGDVGNLGGIIGRKRRDKRKGKGN